MVISVPHDAVRSASARIATPVPACVQTTLSLKEAPLADSARYDRLHGIKAAARGVARLCLLTARLRTTAAGRCNATVECRGHRKRS